MDNLTNYTLLTIVLIIISLFLNEWRPPLNQNFISVIVLIAGLTLGYMMVGNLAYGFCIAGLVFFKDRLVNEFKDIKDMTKEQ